MSSMTQCLDEDIFVSANVDSKLKSEYTTKTGLVIHYILSYLSTSSIALLGVRPNVGIGTFLPGFEQFLCPIKYCSFNFNLKIYLAQYTTL